MDGKILLFSSILDINRDEKFKSNQDSEEGRWEDH
jgi:hypothetical protein